MVGQWLAWRPFFESSSVDYASFGFGLVNKFTAEKNRENRSRVPTAQRLSLGQSSTSTTSIPPRIAITTPIDKHLALGMDF